MTDIAKNDPKSTKESAAEDELLNSPRPTPSEATPSVPAPSPTALPPPEVEKDTIAERVQTIFGQKRASDDTTDSEPVTKVVNTGGANDTSSTTIVIPTGVVAAPANMEVDTPPVQTVNKTAPDATKPDTQPVDMDTGDDGAGDDPSQNQNQGQGPVENDNNDPPPIDNDNNDANNDGWPEEVDQPAEFPDIGFPVAPPTYPSPPEFNYRYRSGPNSTPQRRRIDHDRSVVLPQCRRDPHTNRIAQDDYDAREQAEMALSLGYVFL